MEYSEKEVKDALNAVLHQSDKMVSNYPDGSVDSISGMDEFFKKNVQKKNINL